MSRTRAIALPSAVLALLAAGCGGTTATTAASPATPSATSSAVPTPAVPAPSSPAGPRTSAELEQALLSLDDLPPGYAVDRGEGDEETVVTGSGPGCAPLVALLKGGAATGATASARVSLDGGTDEMSFDESLDAYPEAVAAVATVTQEATSVGACDALTLGGPDDDPITFTVDEISFPDLGQASFAARLTAETGPLEDLSEEEFDALSDEEFEALGGYLPFEVVVAGAAAGDVVVHTFVLDGYADEAGEMTKKAVEKVQRGGSSAAPA